LGPPGSIESVTEQSPEASVNNINSLIQRVAGASIQEIENLISRHDIHAHDCGQRGAVERLS